MKTVLINCSPKKRFAASSYLVWLQSLSLRGHKVKMNLRSGKDYAGILRELEDADNVVFCMPLYVDAVPSHVLPFMAQMEQFCREKSLHPRLYVLSNNGFIEGKQNGPLMEVMENFCLKSGTAFGGGVGIGGGVMMNVMTIILLVQIALFVIMSVLQGMQSGIWFPADDVLNLVENIAVVILLQVAIFWDVFRMGIFINRGKSAGKKYTRILLPSFVFILFADVFFLIFSVLEGGIFRGWLRAKQPPAGEDR
jgi:hypothetical protein